MKKEQSDLTTLEGRKAAIENINLTCKKELQENFRDINKDLIVHVGNNYIQLSILETNPDSSYFGDTAFNSGIDVYDSHNLVGDKEKEVRMSVSSSGSFNPKTSKASQCKILHAASLLSAWNLTERLVNKYCQMYRDLETNITKENA
jgi:hypothetical protein